MKAICGICRETESVGDVEPNWGKDTYEDYLKAGGYAWTCKTCLKSCAARLSREILDIIKKSAEFQSEEIFVMLVKIHRIIHKEDKP